MGMADRIKERRLAMGYTQEELAEKLGLQKSAIAKYENGRVENIKRSVIDKMSVILDCSPSYLMGWDDVPKKHVTIPVLGRVAAGIPIDAVELVIGSEEIPEDMALTGEFFCLKIKGDSMEPDIHDGDTVVVRRQDDAESGQVVIALVNGDDGVCKRLKKYQDSIALLSNNAAYEPMYFNKDEIDQTPVRIIGKVVELRRKF